MKEKIKKHLLNAYLSLAIVSIFWGTTYYAIHVGVQYTSGFALAGLRQALRSSDVRIRSCARGIPVQLKSI